MDKILKIFLGNEKTKINSLISKEYVVKYGQENKEGTLECLTKKFTVIISFFSDHCNWRWWYAWVL